MQFRSLLYVPACEERFITKAHTRGADAIILDLEDGVAPARKSAARARLSTSVAQSGQSGKPVFVRINSDPDTACKDVEAAVQAGAYGLYVAKANNAHLSKLNEYLDRLETAGNGQPTALVALIEDANALLESPDIARQPRVMALTVGAEDLAYSLGAAPDPDVLRQPKLMVHYAAKSQGLLSFGMFRTVADYSAVEEIRASAREAKKFGFDGASCVHPTLVKVLNRAFSHSPQQIEWAERVLAKSDDAEGAAFSSDGKMVDEAVLARARKILAAG